MSMFGKFFGGGKRVYQQPNLRPRSGSSLFNFMMFAASCAGGYVLFHSQMRELASLHAEDNKSDTGAGAGASAAGGATEQKSDTSRS